jgi:hypothetical protein
MINNDDIRKISAYFNGEAVETSEIERLKETLKLIVKQIDIQVEFNRKMDEVSTEFEKIKTSCKKESK